MNIDKIVYYKETTLNDGRKIVESGFVDYEHIYKSLIAKQEVASNKKINKMIKLVDNMNGTLKGGL